MPTSGSLFLYNRKVVKHFRNDGHNWRKNKDGKTLQESHGKLMDEGVEVLQCYYARGAQNNNFCRRIYWLIEEKLSHIVLVHYLEEEGKKASVICSKEYEESNPCAQQTYKVMANTEMETSRSSNLHPHSYHIHLQTNGAQASECEEAELAFNSEANSDLHSFLELQCPVSQKIKTQLVGSNCSLPLKDDQERLPVFRQVDYIPLSQANETRHINNVGSACEPSKLLGYYSSWQHILDNTAASYDELFQPSFPEIQSNNMEINSTSQQYEVMGQPFSSTITKQHQNGSLIQSVGNWQVLD
ncbi:calmodulin-binding transcription activator 3 isoform X2 [Medicago truncatula]|uniref:calmodulin-binding transcription activator 3 isoform X2 n=1 Tax=Medicago truncatula TaxID=3880 RepID=UPI0019689F27|nr:calmodulin-binding transcription activator 3 isoform X2 [Medicago truncatula]